MGALLTVPRLVATVLCSVRARPDCLRPFLHVVVQLYHGTEPLLSGQGGSASGGVEARGQTSAASRSQAATGTLVRPSGQGTGGVSAAGGVRIKVVGQPRQLTKGQRKAELRKTADARQEALMQHRAKAKRKAEKRVGRLQASQLALRESEAEQRGITLSAHDDWRDVTDDSSHRQRGQDRSAPPLRPPGAPRGRGRGRRRPERGAAPRKVQARSVIPLAGVGKVSSGKCTSGPLLLHDE